MNVFTNNVAIQQKNHNPNLTSQINSFSVDDTLSLAENNSFNSADGKFGQDLRNPDVLPNLTESLNTLDFDRSLTEDEPKLEGQFVQFYDEAFTLCSYTSYFTDIRKHFNVECCQRQL